MHKISVFRILCLVCICIFFGIIRNAVPAAGRNGRFAGRKKASGPLKITAWNIETFFDARRSGTEYPEFLRAGGGWNQAAYEKRLERLCRSILRIDADVFIMEEIEQKGILYDISNRLAVQSWHRGKQYRYGCFASAPGSALGCAVLSRYPLSGLTVHAVDNRTGTDVPPPMRPLLVVSVSAGNRSLVLYVNHWKSQSGGKSESAVWRLWQESVLAGCIARRLDDVPDTGVEPALLACGDFNRDITEFVRYKTNDKEKNCHRSVSCPNMLLRYSIPGFSGMLPVRCPWILPDGQLAAPGSYYYKGKGECLDSFFAAGRSKIRSFRVETDGDWATAEGLPRPYRLSSGSGYSDHLPVSCTVGF